MARKLASIVEIESCEPIPDTDRLSVATMKGKGYGSMCSRKCIYRENGKIKIPVNQTFPMQGKDYDVPKWASSGCFHKGHRRRRHDCYGAIYMIMHEKSGMAYIGQTTRKIPDRVGYSIRSALERKNGLKNTRLSIAIRQHGIESFSVWELSRHYSREELDNAEKDAIKKYSTNRFAGFNLESGGKRGFTHHRKSKEKMSVSRTGAGNGRYGKPVSEETRRKIGFANSGERSAWKGKKHTADELRRIGESNREYFRLHPERADAISARRKKKVICRDTGEVFESLASAANHFGVSGGSISTVCSGKRDKVKGFHFGYYKENGK